MTKSRVFVPHDECWMASGACFEEGRCLGSCQPKLPAAKANSELATAIRLLKEFRNYTLLFRSMTHYVDGSSIDLAVKEAADLIARHKSKILE